MATKKIELEFFLLPRLPFDRDGIDDEMARTGYLVINDLGSMHKMSWNHAMKKFFFADDLSVPVDMDCIRAWVRLPVINLPRAIHAQVESISANEESLFVLSHAL